MTVEIQLTESLVGSGVVGKKWRARIIQADRWGSSAYYPSEVLERDGSRVFTAGLPMYQNHPTESDKWEQPERRVQDMVGKLISDAEFIEGDGLYADVEFYNSFVDSINEKHEDVGLSVRATGLTEDAEMDGRFGPVLLGLLAADSVDVVTKAGAGGKLTSILESDRTLAGQPIEPKENSSMNEDEKKAFTELVESVQALTGTVTDIATRLEESLAGSAGAGASTEDTTTTSTVTVDEAAKSVEVNVGEVVDKLVEAELPATGAVRARVIASVKAGISLDEAIKEEVDFRESIGGVGNVHIEESAKATGIARSVEILG